jgi:hypothetical protein
MSRKLFGLLVLLIPAIALAQGYEKNGLPCISELCIGDGLPELGKIKWDRAKSDFSITGKPDYVGSHPLPATAVTLVKNVYRGDLTKAAPYLSYQAFDGSGLALLANVSAACATQELRGTFTSQNGNPTSVKIALLSDKHDVSIQRWTVTSISRNYPAAVSDAQKADIRKQLNERYDRFNVSHGMQRGVEALYSIHDDPMLKAAYGLTLSFKIPVNELERERQNPACSGQRKISVD